MYTPSLSIVLEYVPLGALGTGYHIQEPKLIEMRKKLESDFLDFEKDTVRTVFDQDPNVLTELAVQRKHLERRESEIKDIQSDLDSKFLSETFKLKIALDIAKGLRYLHSFQPPILHQDICSTNIYVKIEFFLFLLRL
jgi:serine/threonine protein kinase